MLLTAEPSALDLESAWQLLEGLQLMFLTLAAHDTAYVRSLLDVERGLEKRPNDRWEEPWPYYGWGRVRWRDVFPTLQVDELPDAGSAAAKKADDSSEAATTRAEGSPSDEGAHAEAFAGAVERLQRLFHARVENGRKRRTRLALRNRFLLYSLLVLAL
jgi:hypothetical protein